jgi:hypothetical protein
MPLMVETMVTPFDVIASIYLVVLSDLEVGGLIFDRDKISGKLVVFGHGHHERQSSQNHI